MRRFVVLIACVLAACAPMEWVKQDAGAEQVSRDEQECRQMAWREASSRAYFPPLGPVFARDGSGRGYFVWPSGALSDPYGQQFLEENRLAHFCMRAKGYQLVPVEKRAEKAPG